MFTFATTATAVGTLGASISTMSCAVYGAPCTGNCPVYEIDGAVDDGVFDLADVSVVQDSGSPDAADAAFIDDDNGEGGGDSGDGGD